MQRLWGVLNRPCEIGWASCLEKTVDYTRQGLKWNGWGRVGQDFDLQGREQDLWSFFQEQLGIASPVEAPAASLDQTSIPDSRLHDDTWAALKGIFGDRVTRSRYERAFHAVGKSYYDLIRIRTGTLPCAPDAVVYPHNADELTLLIELAHSSNLVLVPFGGGSSVVGGVESSDDQGRVVITVDMTKMNRIVSVDEQSMTAVVQAGIYGPDLEVQLRERGWTLSHYPQSFQFSTLGGWIAARGSGQQSNRYGSAEKFMVSAQLVTPKGKFECKPFPKSAAGPDLAQLIAGSEGIFGFITQATIRLHPVPPSSDYRGFLFADFETGASVVREIVQDGVSVAMLRLSDADETFFLGQQRSYGRPKTWFDKATDAALDLVGVGGRPCLLLVGMEGTTAGVATSRLGVAKIALGHGGLPLGAKPGRAWYRSRFDMPYLRDALLDRGIGVDTVETSTSWSNIHNLHREVRDTIDRALQSHTRHAFDKPIVMAHISHSYRDGASLYFTFVFPVDSDAQAQWKSVKRDISDAIVAHGGTISHHHGVGRDHRAWLDSEKGPLGVAVIASAKKVLDPHHVMNPGKLLPSKE